jgi:voltage-gated potassium channel
MELTSMNSVDLADNCTEKQAIEREQCEILRQLEDWLDLPMLLLSFAWLALFVIELVGKLTPQLEILSLTIWILFILEFAVKLLLAPRKASYLRTNWLTVLSLILPALRTLRIVNLIRVLKTTRAVRGLRLLRVLTRTNRSMRALTANFTRRGFGYVVLLTIIVSLIGAAGVYAFENETVDVPGFQNYGEALWWTAMLLTTMGSDYFPKTVEGRVLCLLLAIYGFAVFGYVTATLATFFIGRDADDEAAELAGTESIAQLKDEITALRAEIQTFLQQTQS